ncbi:hypothetical protein [Yoonia sp.]|uniref:hypothetical protein n=1 Tax=Yoonia sp. TaxID=2212373 RepID=UPI004047C6AF
MAIKQSTLAWMMISSNPKTKQDLIKALQNQNIRQIEIIEPYVQTRQQELIKETKQISTRSGDVTIILVRTQ